VSGVRLCGLDVGISTTDAVGDWAEDRAVSLPTGPPAETATIAIRRLLETTPPPDDRPIVIAATGFGAHRLGDQLAGFPLRKIPELVAIGWGGTRVAGIPEALVVSLGTGTALVSVRDGELRHVSPGTGVGGGTLLGIARSVFGLEDLDALMELVRRGERSRVDLSIGEVAGGPLGALPPDATASNLGKCSPRARREDVAAGLVNLVTEVVLTVTLLGLQASGQGRAILIGKLMLFEPIGKRIADVARILHPVLVLPERGTVATALGAMWAARAEVEV
jgi:type II pantothenate kinase